MYYDKKRNAESNPSCISQIKFSLCSIDSVVVPFVAGLYLLFAHRRELFDIVVQAEDGASEKECLGNVED